MEIAVTARFNKGEHMARIIVTTDPNERPDTPVLLDERVNSLHLCDDHAAKQQGLAKRLGKASRRKGVLG